MPEPATATQRFPLGPIAPLPRDAIDRPGTRRIRIRLTRRPQPRLAGQSTTSVRSGPRTLETDWANVEDHPPLRVDSVGFATGLANCLPATSRAATRTASIKLEVSALPCQAMLEGRAVRDAGPDDQGLERHVHGSVEPNCLQGHVPWSWYIATTASNSPAIARTNRASLAIGPVRLDAGLDRASDGRGEKKKKKKKMIRSSSSPNRPFASVRIERGHGDHRGGFPAVNGRIARSARRIFDSTDSTVEEVEDTAAATCRVA